MTTFLAFLLCCTKDLFIIYGIPGSKKNESNVFILIDVSTSMTAKDLIPTRSAQSIKSALDFILDHPAANISMGHFDTELHIAIPFTQDKNRLEQYLTQLPRYLDQKRGSNFERTINQLSEYLLMSKKDLNSISVIVFSDFETMDEETNHLRFPFDSRLDYHLIAMGTKEGYKLPFNNFVSKVDFEKLLKWSYVFPNVHLSSKIQLRQGKIGLLDPANKNPGEYQLQTTLLALALFLWLFSLLLKRINPLISLGIICCIVFFPGIGQQNCFATHLLTQQQRILWANDLRGSKNFDLASVVYNEVFQNTHWNKQAIYSAFNFAIMKLEMSQTSTALEIFAALKLHKDLLSKDEWNDLQTQFAQNILISARQKKLMETLSPDSKQNSTKKRQPRNRGIDPLEYLNRDRSNRAPENAGSILLEDKNW